MKVAISGGTGLLGQAITKILLEQGHEVVILSRSKKDSTNKRLSYASWNPAAGELDIDAMSHVDGIINLAGAPVAQRWTASNKKAILDSRVDSTKCLVDYVLNQPNQVKSFVSASAIGIYPSSKELMTVSSNAGKGLLSDV
ncbi:MAG: NAD-dependent epimerase/dehydratase family protein, partial [Flavobacteriales bacterium]|nr:NAD-dependent epimerase/dehydratase family protein [Flavobacteriales bacterium]